MSKQGQIDFNQSNIRKKIVKSTDLKRRLFEVGLNLSPNANINSPLLNTIASPKRNLLTKHPLSISTKQEPPQLLKFHPSNSPQLSKTSKDFHIRKSPKQMFFPASPSSKNRPINTTLSSFYKPDSIRGDTKDLKTKLLQHHLKSQQLNQSREQRDDSQSKLDQYVSLVLRGVEHIDEFLYLVRGSEENIYQLELVNFELVRQHEGQANFEYYTVSKKGFCHYIGGKPHAFLDILEWSEEKSLYMKIKALKFFYRFRRWKTLQMWRRTITKQRRQAISHSLMEKLYILQPTTRVTLLELRKLTLEMQRSVLIIAKNEGTYTLQSFKHCQERARREASLAVEEFSRESRTVVRKCFDIKLSQLRENMKKKAGDDKSSPQGNTGSQSPKESAFQALGFPSKMTYEHRSKLRKQAGKFLRFSYLVDSIHLSCLAGLYSSQISLFISRLEEFQLGESVKLRPTLEQGKDEIDRERMFILQLVCNFKDIPQRLVAESEQKEDWSPSRDIRLRNQQRGNKHWIPRLVEFWLNLQPNLDQVLDELGFLIREGLGSLKCFEKWARHRQMQKYVSILEQWDDLVSENWEISQNDNLDPLLLLDSLDPAFTKLKMILKTTESKLLDVIKTTLTDLLNAYWEYSQLPLLKLQSQDLANPAQTFEQFLLFTSKLLQRVTNQLPHRIELGVISVQITKIKTFLGQKFAAIIQNLKCKLPELVEERTNILNNWLTLYGVKLREEILTIDDFVKIVDVIKQIEKEFAEKREECNELAQLYQTMQQFRMDTRRRKDFETITLKLKDQLEQLIITAEQNIQRKTDLYTKEVLKYHLPSLVKDINKALQNVQQPRFLKLDSYRSGIFEDLQFLQSRQNQLIEQRNKCENYMNSLKIQGQSIGELNQLSRQISSRVQLWKTLQRWQAVTKEYQSQTAKVLPLSLLIELVQEYKETIQKLQQILPPNQILTYLKHSVKEYHIYLPILNGFSESLSESHWSEIYDTLPQKYGLDLKKRQFTLYDFLKSGIGTYSKEIHSIFQKCRVEAKLQRQYQEMEDNWQGLVAKIKTQGRFMVIANGEVLRQQLDKVLFQLTTLLSNPHAQSLKQYSITYQSVFSAQECFDHWLKVQTKMVEVERNCRLLDIKKLPDYNFFENAQRLYKQITKSMSNKGAELGVKIGKLLVHGIEDKLKEIELNLAKIEENIKNILRQHRRVFPSFYLFSDPQLIKLITEQSRESIQSAAKRLIPSISRLQFENQRISSIITIDEDRFIKNPISVNSQIEQILFQITQTTSELNRRALRNCRYKAVENNLSGLVQQYNIQHLLAISRVDFSHYTTISIDNQQDTPDSLIQFRKVMRKDTAQDIKNRQYRASQVTNSLIDTNSILNTNGQLINTNELISTSAASKRNIFLHKYDTLLLQQLLYEEILDYLIKNNIGRAEEYPWASQLKFFWEQTSTEEPNITIKQMHLSLKYGNQFIGSNTKVILHNEPQALLGLKHNDCVVYNGNKYSIQRLLNAVGYKMITFTCTELTTHQQLRHFVVGSCYAEYIPFLNRADQLPGFLLQLLPTQKWIQEFKSNNQKRNSPYLRQMQRNHSIFLNVRNAVTGWQPLQGTMRIVQYMHPKKELLRCNMRLRGMFSDDKTNLLLRIFQAVAFLEEKSKIQGVSLQEFLDKLLLEGEEIDEHQIFFKLLAYLKPKVGLQTHHALTKHIESLALLPFNFKGSSESKNKIESIFECLAQRKVIVLTGRGYSKRYFVKKHAQKLNIAFIQLFAQNISKEHLFAQAQTHPFEHYANNPNEDHILYFKAVTSELLLCLENLLYADIPSSKPFFTSKAKIILDVSTEQKLITPRELSSFPILHFETPRDYINALPNQWLNRIEQQDKKRNLNRIIFQIIIPSLQSLTAKDQIILQKKLTTFINYLSSLYPFKNLLDASIYSLVTIYRASEQEQIKLQYLVKKHLGEDKISEDTKISNLFFKQANQEKIITDKEYLKIWLEQNEDFNDQTYILTPSLLHQLVISRRIHEKTDLPILLEGTQSSGKTALMTMYRKIHHQNSFYMHISAAQGPTWNRKLTSSLQRHGLNVMGAKINYQQSIVMIEDLHLADAPSLLPLELMLFYSKCHLPQKDYNIRNVKFILSAHRSPERLQNKCLKINLGLGQEQLQAIFTSLLSRHIDKDWQLSQLFINKIANTSIELCQKVILQDGSLYKQSYSALRRVLVGFSRLKIKQGLTVQKQIQKFWSFALLQSLKSYDQSNILPFQLKKLDLPQGINILSYTHLSSNRPTEKKIDFLKDPKRLYNFLNQKIERYNESDTKRYGQSFQFLNFDPILQKIITISHSILLDSDHLIVGRKGTGKQSLAKLSAFLNGHFYKTIKGSIKNSIIELIQANVSSPHLLYKSISQQEDQATLHEYYYSDFQSQILSGSNKPRTNVKQKEKQKEKQKSSHLKSIHKNMSTIESFTTPKPKLTQEEVAAYRRSFRLIASLDSLTKLKSISAQVRSKVHIDTIDEVPAPSILQYNQKLITVDGITCTKDSQIILSELFEYSRQQLGLSLRSNDDCVRLFSSFLANLVNEMVMEEERYSRMLDLLKKMKHCNAIINEQVSRLHSKLKQLSQNSENSREIKIQIQNERRQKSTAQSISDKLTQILSWLQPLYSRRLSCIKNNLSNRNSLEMTFAVTASYFIYLSNIPYQERRKTINQWYKKIPLISQMQPIESFLSLFLLYEEEFNAEPVDHLPQFYQNMAIIFHSAKPIAIRDKSERGRSWLEKNCSFFYLREDQKNFNEMLKEYLGKSSNILIEVVEQQTLNKITESLIGTLLFLPESVSSVNIRGEQVDIHQEAKVYLLLAEGLVIGKEVEQEFTVVLFDESEEQAKSAIMHEYFTYTQRECHTSKLDYHRKIRSLNLDCQNVIGQIADSIYQQLCGTNTPPEQPLLIEKLSKMTDKLMVRVQNQFTKIKEKEALVVDLKEKYDKVSYKIIVEPAQQFYTYAKKIRGILQLMTHKENNYYCPSFAQYFRFLRVALQKGIISSIVSLMISVLRQWGPLYSPQHYTIFAFLLIMVKRGKQPQQFIHLLTEEGIANKAFLSLVGIHKKIIDNERDLTQVVSDCFISLLKQEQFKSIGPLLISSETPELPLIWNSEGNTEVLRVVKIKSILEPSQVKQKLLINHAKLIEPTEQDPLESLLKKSTHEDIKIIVFSRQGLIQAQRIVRNWPMPLIDKTIFFLSDNNNNYQTNSKQVFWQLQLSNEQQVFTKVISFYKSLTEPAQNLEPIVVEQPVNFTSTSVSYSVHSESIDYNADNYMKLILKITNCIKQKHQCLSLSTPLFNTKELVAIRKLLQNNQNPLKLPEKISLIFQSVCCVLCSIPNQVRTYIKSLESKIYKSATELSSEQQFFKDVLSVQFQPIQFDEKKEMKQKSNLELQFGWLTWTRRFFGLENKVLQAKYIRQIEDYIALSSIYNQAPTVTRGSKRQPNIKSKRESLSKKGRQSISLTKKSPLNKQQPQSQSKAPSSLLASQYLLKESQYYQHILHRIHKELQQSRGQLINVQNSPISSRTLSILLSIMKNQPIGSWKLLLCEVNCASMPLSLAIKSMISRRNEIYTHYNKFSVSESCELDFRSIRYPLEFLRAFFKSEITTQDAFMLATMLTPEQAERGDYLRVNGMWGLGWRLTQQGLIQSVADNKLIQMNGCYLIKKPITGFTVNGIDLLSNPQSPELMMRVFALSKKAQGSSWLKLFLKNE